MSAWLASINGKSYTLREDRSGACIALSDIPSDTTLSRIKIYRRYNTYTITGPQREDLGSYGIRSWGDLCEALITRNRVVVSAIRKRRSRCQDEIQTIAEITKQLEMDGYGVCDGKFTVVLPSPIERVRVKGKPPANIPQDVLAKAVIAAIDNIELSSLSGHLVKHAESKAREAKLQAEKLMEEAAGYASMIDKILGDKNVESAEA